MSNYILYKKNDEQIIVHSTEEYERLADNKLYFKTPHEAKAAVLYDTTALKEPLKKEGTDVEGFTVLNDEEKQALAAHNNEAQRLTDEANQKLADEVKDKGKGKGK